MSYQKTFRRYELKYLITKDQQEELIYRMKKYMAQDEFAKSTISNIYFDTPDKLFIRNSLEKPIYKEKLRVRSYGTPSADSAVFIELKKKYKGVVYKRRINMEEKIASSYLVDRMPLLEKSQISNEIDYLYDIHSNLEPSVFLSYEREAFFSKTDTNFRMTFDQNITFRDYDLSLTSGVYGEKILDDQWVVLEVKTVYGLPKWLLDFFNECQIVKTSFSKYGSAYTQHILPKYLENLTKKQDKYREHDNKGDGINVA
ncbi:MAG: polyphosphate polymerase domain-containing protein [Clostridium sp.]|nr:polyphosphate polymerase domain-containing protein [Clostridium sp.]